MPDRMIERESSDQILSQRDYRETPYQDTEWEKLDADPDAQSFQPLSIPVLDSGSEYEDYMFDDFGAMKLGARPNIVHSSNPLDVREERSSEEGAFDLALFEEELLRKYDEGRQAGFEEGKAAAEREARAEYDLVESRVKDLSKAISQQVESVLSKLEKRAVEFALAVSKKILVTTADAKPEYIVEVIREGLKNLGASKPLRVRVSPQDLEFLEVVGVPPEYSEEELGIQYAADESIHSGCVIETDFGEVDMQLEKMWEQVKGELFEVYK